MVKRQVIRDGWGRTWTVEKIRRAAAADADFRFWYDGLTAEQRVGVVAEALESCLKARGLDGIPRLRRVHRRVIEACINKAMLSAKREAGSIA
jgi:hypothetical protein